VGQNGNENEVIDPQDDFKNDQGKQADPRGGVLQPLHQELRKFWNRQSYMEMARLAGDMPADEEKSGDEFARTDVMFRAGSLLSTCNTAMTVFSLAWAARQPASV